MGVKTTLKLAGTNVKTFEAHSTSADSTSETNATGLALGETLEKGSWFNASTWKRFFKKDIIPTNFKKAFLTYRRSIENNRYHFEQRKEICAPAKLSVVLKIQYQIEL